LDRVRVPLRRPAERIEDSGRDLSPQSDIQRSLQSRALQISGNVMHTSWLLFEHAGNSVTVLLLVVL
jgi:hypothetical protein